LNETGYAASFAVAKSAEGRFIRLALTDKNHAGSAGNFCLRVLRDSPRMTKVNFQILFPPFLLILKEFGHFFVNRIGFTRDSELNLENLMEVEGPLVSTSPSADSQ
jgi:hypothetical protein